MTLAVRRDDCRGGGRWCVSVGAAPHRSDGGVLTGDGDPLVFVGCRVQLEKNVMQADKGL